MPPSYNTLAAGSSNGVGAGNSQQHHYHNLPIIAGVGRSHSPGPGTASASVSGTMFSYHNPTLAASPYSTLPRRLHQQSSVTHSV